MKKLIPFIAIFLTACQTMVPVNPPTWPVAPKELTEKCPILYTIDPANPAITELLKTVVKNYELYYYCSLKQEGWNDWYNVHKQNYESIFKK